LYWASRYLERAEHTARLIDINMGLMLDRSRVSTEARWQRVLDALGSTQAMAWGSEAGATGDARRWTGATALIHSLCFDTTRHASITACIFAARENARQIRDEISTEQWQRLNEMFHQTNRLRTAAPPLPGGDGHDPEPRRGMAIPAGGTLSGARVVDYDPAGRLRARSISRRRHRRRQ
jgi:uncharacterized alpha-E superfamily protein